MSSPSGAFAADAKTRTVDASLLGQYMAGLRGGFAESDLGSKTRQAQSPYEPHGPVSFSPSPDPKHFTPANPGQDPTAGWDPFNPIIDQPPPTPQPDATDSHDAVAAARTDGFSEGYAAGELAASTRQQEIEAIDRLAQTIARISDFDREAVATRLRQTVLHLVTRMVGEAGVSPDLLQRRVDAAVALLADDAEPARIRLHPEDLKLIEGHVPGRLSVVADKTIERGGIRIETRTTTIEDGPAAWLAQLAAAIDRTALPDAG